jgi:ABC-type nitrate/sulfonate/bicarbonate transport system ATPase subunit
VQPKQVEKTYNLVQRLQLKDLNLEIEKGSFVCVVGDVGCGKSSLLASIIGEMIYVDQSISDKHDAEE